MPRTARRTVIGLIAAAALLVPAVTTLSQGIARASGPASQEACGNPTTQVMCIGLTTLAADGTTAPPAGALNPAGLQGAYNLQSATQGMQQTIAIVGAGAYTTAEQDLAHYRAQWDLPDCTIADGCLNFENENGQSGSANLPPGAFPGWDIAYAESLDAVSAVCPNCHILVIEASTTNIGDFATAANTAGTAPGVVAVDNPYGELEESLTPAEETGLDADYDHPGVAMVAPAGDSGYDGGLVQYPSASQYVVSVGGTILDYHSSTGTWTNGGAWPNSLSGCSLYEPKLKWQTDDTGQGDCANRTVNDVSAVAADATDARPFAYYDSTENAKDPWFQAGGTNLAAAVITGVYALAGSPGPTPPADPYLNPGGAYTTPSHAYTSFTGLTDITTGTNCTGSSCTCTNYECNAGPGYDGPTGLGVPNGVESFTSAGSTTGNIYGDQYSLCLDNTGGKITNGNPIQVFTCSGSTDGQQWQIRSDGTIQIGGSCLGLSGTSNGDGLILNSCDGATTQQWNMLGTGQILNQKTGKCIEDPSGGTSGTQVVIDTCNDSNTGQQWATLSPEPAATGEIRSQYDTSKCMDTSDEFPFAGGTLDIWDCGAHATDEWTIAADGQITNNSSSLCIEPIVSITHDNLLIPELEACGAGQTGELFVVQSNGALYNPASGACIGNGDATLDGTLLEMAPPSGFPSPTDCLTGSAVSWDLP